MLLVADKAIQVLSHDNLDGVDARLMLCYLGLEEGLVALAVLLDKANRGRDVKIVQKAADVK